MDVNLKEEEPLLQSDNIRKTIFSGNYQDYMAMYAPAQQVADYLRSHSSWFVRCAEPMKVFPLGENGYILVIGPFGALGYEVEPKIGLELLFADRGTYRIRTIPIPDYAPPGYEINYAATMQLVEGELGEQDIDPKSADQGKTTRVEWQLDLTVELCLPKFIYRLPQSLIQSNGDRLLNQVVRQISRRLTKKVQRDFHQLYGIPFP